MRPAEAHPTVEPLVLAAGRDPRAPLPRARPGRPLRLPRGDGARRRSRPETGESFSEDIGDDNPVAIYVPGTHAHGYEALTDASSLPRHRGVRRRRPGRARHPLGRPARRISGARHRRSSRNETSRVLITGAGGQLGVALAQVFPDADARTRDELTSPLPRSTSGRASFCMRRPGPRWMTRRRTPRKPSWSNVQGTRNVVAAARRSSTTRRTTSSTEQRASRMSSPTSRIRSRCTDARSSRGSARSARAGSSAPRGSSAGRARTSSGRCSSSARNRTRWRSSTTSAARRPSSVIWRKRRKCCPGASSRHVPRGRRWRVHLGGARRGDLRRGEPRLPRAPITTAELGRPAPRPANSVLRSERGAPELPHWREGLRACLARL